MGGLVFYTEGMSVPFLIIDGYNLMHAAGMARLQYGRGDLERCRNAFINLLSLAISEEQAARTIMVFDAFGAPDNVSRKYLIAGMTILFASPGSDADTAIEEMIADHSSPRQVLIVSSDHRIQKAARKRRAQSMDSDVFLLELEKLAEKRKKQGEALPPQKFGHRITELETDYWLDEFGSIPTTMKEAGIEPLEVKENKPSGDANKTPSPQQKTEAPSETDEWTEIFDSIQVKFDNVSNADYWQKQIDDVIEEESDS
ncbi:hypothetical protein MNBD_PLANCTO02-1642 [hydrothermal vent metagenome]|uniref:YacP-like NYN domain protein n=1 Tax=hydrothermal vent metagenome TaxID=652676 RepID=A0A3B1E7R7_9ZZZZ